jgi:hypothetical protein
VKFCFLENAGDREAIAAVPGRDAMTSFNSHADAEREPGSRSDSYNSLNGGNGG